MVCFAILEGGLVTIGYFNNYGKVFQKSQDLRGVDYPALSESNYRRVTVAPAIESLIIPSSQESNYGSEF